MKESVVLEEAAKKTSLDILFIVLTILAAIAGSIIWINYKMWPGIYVFAAICTFNYLLVKPLIEFIIQSSLGDTKVLLLQGLKISFMGVLTIANIYTFYKIIFTYPIIDDKLLWFYYLSLILFIPIVLGNLYIKLKVNYKIIKAEKAEKDRKASNIKYAYTFVIIITIFINSLVLPVFKHYRPARSISLTNLKTPYSLIISNNVEESSENKYKNNYKLKEIKDKEFIEYFIKELSKAEGENIRNLDRLNYDMWYQDETPAYVIRGEYKDSKGDRIYNSYLQFGYFYILTIDKGEVVLEDGEHDRNFNKICYRLKLPKGFLETVLNNIRAK